MEGHRLDLPAIPNVPPADAQRMVEAGALLVDVREIDEYQQVRIDGARFMPLSEFAESYTQLPTDVPVILYCRTGARSGQATAALTHQAGFDNVFNMDGGIVEWYEEGLPVATGPVVTPDYDPPFLEVEPDRAYKDMENEHLRWIVDVREDNEFATGHIAGAQNIPFRQLPFRYAELPRGEAVLVACDQGQISYLAASLLVDLGFGDVRVLAGGLEAWRYRDLPLQPGLT